MQRARAPRSPRADAAFQRVVGKVRATATQQRTHASPESKAEEASAAAHMPPDERKGRAQERQASQIQSAAAIASGDTTSASKGIENALAQALPVAIGFLASLIGLGDLPKKIQGVIQKVQAPINKAIQWLIGKAKVMAKSVLSKLKGAFNKDKKGPAQEEKPLPGDKSTRWKAGIAALKGLDAQDQKELKTSLAGIQKTYGFDTLTSKRKGKDWSVKAVMRQEDEVKVEGDRSSREISRRFPKL